MSMPMPLPNDLPVPSTSRVLRPRSRAASRFRSEALSAASSRPNSTGSSHSHGSSVSGTRMTAQPNSSINPMLPWPNGLIGPGVSAQRPATSSSHTMDAEDINQWWPTFPYPASSYAPSLAPGDDVYSFGTNELPGTPVHYPASATTSYPYENSNYQSSSEPYGRSLGWEEPVRGFTMGSSESSLAGALGDGRKRKREDSTAPNFYPPQSYTNGGSSTGFSTSNIWVPPYAGPSHIGSNFDYREPSSSQSGSGSMDTRYFDEGLYRDQFPIQNADVQTTMGEANSAPADDTSESDRKGKGKAREPLGQNVLSNPDSIDPGRHQSTPSTSEVSSTSSKSATTKTTKPPADPLSDFTCPICFYAPTNATITPCGHICCGSCLFTAVKTGMQRAGMEHHPGNRGRTAPEARCPVCRSIIPGWDGKGGGVIGLKVRAIFSF